MKKFSEFCAEQRLSVLDEIYIFLDESNYQMLREGKWVDGKFERNIRIDQPTHGVGQTHAHVHGRKGDEIGVVNWDGSASHGTRMRLAAKDATALRNRGFAIPDDNIIEWCAIPESAQLLLG